MHRSLPWHLGRAGDGMLRRIAIVLAILAGTLVSTLPSAIATPVATGAAATTPIHVAAVCHYFVNGDGVAVRRAPDIDSEVIKRKNYGDPVTGPCYNYYNGRWWTQVYLGSGGTGWMASAYLLYRGYW